MTSLIDDETATRYYNEIDTAPEEERQQMADALLAWGEEKQSREREETDTHFSKLFTDDSYYQQVNDNDPSLSEALDPEATAKRASIHAYLEHQLARPIDAANYEPERDAFAMANYGKKNLDDGQLFEAIRGTYDFQRQRTEAINDLHVQSVGKALADTNLGVNRPFVEGMTGVFNEWQQKYPELVDGKEDAAYLAQAYKLYYDTINDLDAVRPIAGKTLSTLDAFTKGNASGEDLQSLAQTLAQATPEDRDRVYKYVTLGAQAGQIDRAGIEQFAINLGQSFSRGFDFIPQGSLQQMESGVESFLNGIRNGSQVWVPSSGDLTKAVVGNASPDAAAQAAQEGAWRQASVGETETLIASANDAMQTFQVVRELRNVAKTGVDPIRPVMEKGSVMGAVEGGAYGVAGSIGFLGATAINPFLGVAAYQANEYDRIRLENPDMDIRAAQGLALVEGTWQAALDRVQLATLSGKLPVLGRFLGNIENNGIRRTLKVGASVAEQFGQELAQDTGTIVIDNIAAALREDMPDKDFAAEMAKYGEQIPETLAASVMFGLVGGGFATAADLGVTEQQMKIVGINDKKIARIKQATSPEEADALIQSALESRTSEDIEAGKTYARQVFNEAQNPPPESPRISLVAGQDGTDEYLVTAPDGSEMLRTKSQQAAMEAVRQDAESKLLTERNTVRDMVDYFRAQDPTNEAAIEAPRTVQQELDRLTEAGDAKGIANLNERIRFAGIPEGADLTAYNILGEANVETTAEGVFKGVIRLRENSRPEDAFEEINHVFVRKALAEGRTNLDSLRGWLQQTSEATGETYATETETDIIENIAKVGMDYAAGRIEETSLPASFVDYIKRMLQVLKETMARAIKLKDAFATGKIDSNFESFLAESVGLNQQTMVDTTRERVGGELTQGTFNYSVGQRGLPVYTTEQKYNQIIPEIKSVDPSKVSRRDMYEIAEVSPEVAKSMKFDQPVEVSLFADGTMMLSDGHHRLAAAKQLGMSRIPAVVRSINAKGRDINALIAEQVSDQPVSTDTNYSIGKKQDADYLAAVKQGNMETVQKMVDEAANSAGFSVKGFHGTLSEELRNNTFDDEDAPYRGGLVAFFAEDRKFAEEYAKNGGKIIEAHLRLQNPLDFRNKQLIKEAVTDFYAQTGGITASEDIHRLELGDGKDVNDDNEFSIYPADLFEKALLEGRWDAFEASEFTEWVNQQGHDGIVMKENDSITFAVYDPTQIKSADPITRDEQGNVIPLSQRFDQTTGNINYSIGKKQSAGGIRFDEITKEDPKHDGSRVGTAWQGKVKPTTQQTNDGIATIKPNELEKQMAMLTQFVDGVPLPKYITKFKDAQKRMRAFLDFQKGNLLALYDAFNALSADFVIRSTHWYDGARLLAEGVRDNYRLTIEQSSAIIAVFSPMKDWFQNVAMGQRFADVMANHKNKKITKAKMGGAMREMLDAAEDDRKIRKAFKQIEGRSISQLLKDKSKEGRTIAAVAVRLMSTNVHGLTHDVLSPEGESLGIRKNLDGTNKKLVWQSYTFIEKAISIYEDGSAKNISKVLGTEHKIRNFYNNIVAPTSPFGDATVDTHAVNAAVLYPMGNKGYLVGLNFGNAGVAGGGNSGIYWLFHEALREAAKERGVMPRQMQSITWEAIRGLFTDIRKRDKNFVAGITKIWETSSNADAARTQIIGLGITPPEWARVGSSNSGGEGGMRSSTGQVADSAGSVQSGIRQGRQGGDRRAGVNYSIASQSEIDRVNRALGGMNRGPDERLKVYERARAKFQGVMERNREALESLNKDTAKFRRTQLLQGLGELDAILSVFPPDIRGRVGGYTKLANIAPMDVFKDGEKVSEVSGMNGALISAWMRQGMSIGQAGQQTELPPGYTTKENLATARADKALADFFKQRIGMIDREVEKSLRKEYDEAFRKLLDRTKPKKAAPGEKPKGIGADIQDLFTVVRSAVDMDAVSVAAHIAGLDAKIASGELTAEQEARAQVEAALVALVGDWRNADADRRKSALDEATRIWGGAYADHAQKVIQLREQREVARLEAIQATGKAGQLAGRKSKAIADSGLKGSWKDYILNLLNFDQVTGILFGENSKTANTLIDRQRATENAKEDGQQAKMQALEGFFTDLAGGNLLAGEQLRYNLAQPSMEVQGIKLSELEGLSAVMMWEQEDGRRHMTGELDETGKPSGSWHYDQDFVDEIIANLSPEALQLRDWLLKQYADEYGNINAVYAELNGVNLPQIRNYSPVTVQPISAPTGQVLDPVSGSAMSGASTSPGALRTRGTAIAEPRFADVLQTYISHTLQMEHWKAFAPYIAEANAVLRNRDVQNSVEEKGGAEARKILNAWLDYFAQGGTRDAGAHLALNQGISNVLGRASQVALIGRASTLLVQSTQLGAAVAEMPVKAYLKRMGKLLTGQLGWDAALNSPYIQRRIAQMPPVVQMSMQGLKGAKPTAIQQAGKRLGNLLSGADGLFTAGTYAITYDYHLTKAQELGLTGAEAEAYARNIAERVTDRIAQPTRPGARSLYENTSTNPLARAGWAFASEARKNLALVAYSFAERPLATRMRTLAYVVALNSIASSILRSIWRDILDDEDDELFDDKYWSPKRIALAVATEPLYGFPVLGSTAQNAIYAAFGEYKPTGSMFDVDRAINPVKRIPEYLSGDFEMRDVMRDIDMIVSAMGIAHPNIAAAASITHLAKDLFNLGDSAVDAVTED